MTERAAWFYRPCPESEPPPPAEIGGKAWHLARLAQLGEAVPPWFVLRTRVAAEFGEEESLPAELQRAIRAELAALGLDGVPLAVRSSAVVEDSAGASFAGQFDSVLGVCAGEDEADLWVAIRRVWTSAGGARALGYEGRLSSMTPAGNGPVSDLNDVPAPLRGGEPSVPTGPGMAVIVQAMVEPAVSGVAFSCDPLTGDPDTAVVSAVYGLGEGLVSGELDADTYRVDRAGEVDRVVREKDLAVVLAAGGGTERVAVAAGQRALPTLSDEEARAIAAAPRRLAERLGGPQDVEWALVDSDAAERRLWLLQTRPVTGIPARMTLGGERRVWDNSNIVESYAGVTTPLTFSFARGVYEAAYLQFCALLGVSESLLQAHRHVFANMLGLVRGRIYYNLLNWYRALALLPGYSFNRAFMERMMGVRQQLADPPDTPYVAGRGADLGRLLRMVVRLAWEQRRLPAEIRRFHARVEATLGPLAGVDFRALPADEVAALYRRLEDELLRQWRAPLVNDFLAMIWFGILGRLVERWLPQAPRSLFNDLLCGEGGIISTEPARSALALARRVAESPELSTRFAAETEEAALWEWVAALPSGDPFRLALEDHLARFGDRCMNELKLETVTLGEDPTFLLRMIRAYLGQGRVAPEEGRQRAVRARAEAQVRKALRGPRAWMLARALANARRRVRDRENLRFERTRVFGVARRLFVALGHHLAAAGALAEPRDVFYLTKEEIFGTLDGTAVTADLKGLAAQRRAEFAAYAAGPPPPDRFETFGPPAIATSRPNFPTPPLRHSATPPPPDSLHGMGCCPGVVRAQVRVVRDPQAASDLAGHILVAERTDPGWTLLFPAVEGLLVQRGSLLSHSAIVAREIGLPCVVGIAGLMDRLRDGEWVEMDGTTGAVRRLEALGGSPEGHDRE